MFRFFALTVVLVAVFTGCAMTRTDAEKQREAFRLSHVPKTERSAFLSANALITAGDHYYFEATVMPELKHKTSLLRKAASKYKAAVIKLRGMLPRIQDPTDRKYVSDTISHTEASLKEAVWALPIFEE